MEHYSIIKHLHYLQILPEINTRISVLYISYFILIIPLVYTTKIELADEKIKNLKLSQLTKVLPKCFLEILYNQYIKVIVIL